MENTFAVSLDFIHFLNYCLFDKSNINREIGTIEFATSDLNEIHSFAIWYDDEGDHYVCLPTNEVDENDEEEVHDVL